MKAITILATLAITFTSCNCQKKVTEPSVTANSSATEGLAVAVSSNKPQSTVPTIYYEATARNFSLATKVQNKVLYVSRERNFSEYSDQIQISDADWNEISALANAIDLEKVKDMKWPTEQRYYDGAPHANITFESKGVKYPANGFDHGFPPAEVEKLVNKIMKLVDNK